MLTLQQHDICGSDHRTMSCCSIAIDFFFSLLCNDWQHMAVFRSLDQSLQFIYAWVAGPVSTTHSLTHTLTQFTSPTQSKPRIGIVPHRATSQHIWKTFETNTANAEIPIYLEAMFLIRQLLELWSLVFRVALFRPQLGWPLTMDPNRSVKYHRHSRSIWWKGSPRSGIIALNSLHEYKMNTIFFSIRYWSLVMIENSIQQ